MCSQLLAVWLFHDLVGHLKLADGQLNFVYTPSWLESAATRTISHALPLQDDPFGQKLCRAVFGGLLPEGLIRQKIADQLKIPVDNDIEFLKALGGECAGAVTFLPAGTNPAQGEPLPAVEWLEQDQVDDLNRQIRNRPMLAGADGVSLTLAGSEIQIPVVVHGERIGLPKNGMPSTHILKPDNDQECGSAINEAFCMDLARSIGIPTAKAHFSSTSTEPFMLVQRYDRKELSGQVSRIHQEDFCQAMGALADSKLQIDGGPSFADCFDLVRQATKPSARHQINLLKYAFFNTLVGNDQAHAKHYSLLYTAAGTVLAPLYSVMCTVAYPGRATNMAMSVGGTHCFAELQGRHWDNFASDVGIGAEGARHLLSEMAAEVARNAPELAAWEPYKDHPLIEDIVELIRLRARQTIERLTEAERFS